MIQHQSGALDFRLAAALNRMNEKFYKDVIVPAEWDNLVSVKRRRAGTGIDFDLNLLDA